MRCMWKPAFGIFLASIAWLVAGALPPCLAEGYEVSVDVPQIEVATPLVLPSPVRASLEPGSDPALRFYPPEVDVRRALQVISIGAVLSGMDAGLYGVMNDAVRSGEADLPVVRQIAQGAGHLGDGRVTLGICLALSARDPETARVGAKAVIYSGLLAGIIKYSLGRARPGMGLGPGYYSGPLTLSPGFDSMPSGHSAAAFALATVLARRYPGYRSWFWGLAGLVAMSRVCQGAHWPSDVFMGSAIGILAADTAMREDVGSSVEGQALTSSLPCDSMNLTE